MVCRSPIHWAGDYVFTTTHCFLALLANIRNFQLRSNLTKSFQSPTTPGSCAMYNIWKVDIDFVYRKSTNRWEISTETVVFEYTIPCISNTRSSSKTSYSVIHFAPKPSNLSSSSSSACAC